MCQDLFNDGMVCWGNARGNKHARGEGAPWDMRTWEAKTWFVKKYWMLIGGADGDVWQQTLYWRKLQSGYT